jgi:single-stranded DNA-binding protein
MSLFILATGTLIADPQRRTSQSGKTFVTGTFAHADRGRRRVALGHCLRSGRLCWAAQPEKRRLDSCSITGRAKLTAWTGKDGEHRHGLSVVAERVMTVYAVSKRRIVTARDPGGPGKSLHWGEGGSNV